MSDTYHYEEGAIHYDHKRVIHIENVGSGDMGKLIDAFFKDNAEDAVAIEENGNHESTTLSDPRQAIKEQLLALVDKGDWAEGVTAEDIQQMVCTVLGFGETKLDEEEKKLSEKLWQLFQGGRPGDLGRVRIGWENLVGFMLSKGLLVEKSAPLIDVDFFGNNNGFSNINKGKNHNNQSFKKIIPLLDKYCPQKDKKKN